MKKPTLEILVATMNRGTLDFLDTMFQNIRLEEVLVLVINQTEEDTQLVSDRAHIRVINSFEYGLAKSRNLAIQHAIGDICLVADDDVVYAPDLQKTISEAFAQNTRAAAFIF